VLTDLRSRRVIGDDAFHVLEEQVDMRELTAHTLVRPELADREPGAR
jgi:CPA1 family monovalent cation:H+ antiporter